MTEPGPFAPETVVVEQLKQAWRRRHTDPALAVSTAAGNRLARVTHTDDTQSLLTGASGELVVRVLRTGPALFRFTDAAGRETGTAEAPGRVRTRQLSLRTAAGRRLFLTRRALVSVEWLLTETDPDQNPAPETLGRVTVSTADRWRGLQRYVVETDPGLDASERRTVVTSVVCLHLLRRPPGENSAPG
ncbi:hypothetical protein [Streptomyces humi]|uniref:hypothetical protein n=1 Tax=Streptomyces humi TaxID=1428620 RepID=UPI0006286E0C|nr:hypothetical protein [Streptomyces humi]